MVGKFGRMRWPSNFLMYVGDATVTVGFEELAGNERRRWRISEPYCDVKALGNKVTGVLIV